MSLDKWDFVWWEVLVYGGVGARVFTFGGCVVVFDYEQ